ncbi:MAG: hypothetical protein ACI4QW_04825, partial [Clostridia bacterium]
YNKNTKLTFMQRFSDLQRYAAKRLHTDEKQQIGLKTAAELCRIPYEQESLHDAHVDAEISGEVFVNVFDKKSFAETIRNASEPQKTTSGAIRPDPGQFVLKCPDCGDTLKNKSGWFCHTSARQFFAFMRCGSCKRHVFATVEMFQGKGRRIHYKRRLRFVDKIKNISKICQ